MTCYSYLLQIHDVGSKDVFPLRIALMDILSLPDRALLVRIPSGAGARLKRV